jgi:hypothetical protein
MAKSPEPKSTEAKKAEPTPAEGTSVAARMLLKGPMPEIRRMKLTELRDEVQMWRKLRGELYSAALHGIVNLSSSSPFPKGAAVIHLELGPIRSTLLRG